MNLLDNRHNPVKTLILIAIIFSIAATSSASAGDCNPTATILKSTMQEDYITDEYVIISRMKNNSSCPALLKAKITFWDCDKNDCFELKTYSFPSYGYGPLGHTKAGKVNQLRDTYKKRVFNNLMGTLKFTIHSPSAAESDAWGAVFGTPKSSSR